MRTEHDLLGELLIDDSAYYGIHTARALSSFSITGIPIHPVLVEALVTVKKAATALTGYIGYDKASTVVAFCLNTGKTVREAVLELGFLDEEILSELLRPERLMAPGAAITKED